MGYAFYTLPDGREAGYGVEAECDQPGCTTKIDRGLDYLCGDEPDGHRDPSEPGCGRYFCHRAGHHATHECPNPGRSHADYLDVPELREELSAAQDEIERRISECETHRVLVDAVCAERAAECQQLAFVRTILVSGGLMYPLNKELLLAATEYEIECAKHRQAVVDSIGDA